ncbi:MAG: endonuclease domain-containing protein [Rhodospirillales bacterium]|nr:endonuclease domain-containing protein [Rhodospirillales bacterium]
MTSESARLLRRDATEAEKVLWRLLRNRSLVGAKFRRQCPIGRFVADFACLERRLVVEADGGQHAASKTDTARTAWLESRGFRVLRFWNRDILENPEGVAAAILETLEGTRVSTPSPGRPRRPPSPTEGRGFT